MSCSNKYISKETFFFWFFNYLNYGTLHTKGGDIAPLCSPVTIALEGEEEGGRWAVGDS